MRRIETRLLTKQDGQWQGYSYLWNDAQTDADLVAAAGMDRVYEVRDPDKSGGSRKQTWHYPSRAECMVCHSRAANWVLGLTEMQMNKVHDYGGVQDEQLRTLEHLGVFRVNWAGPRRRNPAARRGMAKIAARSLADVIGTDLARGAVGRARRRLEHVLDEGARAFRGFTPRRTRRRLDPLRPLEDWLRRETAIHDPVAEAAERIPSAGRPRRRRRRTSTCGRAPTSRPTAPSATSRPAAATP